MDPAKDLLSRNSIELAQKYQKPGKQSKKGFFSGQEVEPISEEVCKKMENMFDLDFVPGRCETIRWVSNNHLNFFNHRIDAWYDENNFKPYRS